MAGGIEIRLASGWILTKLPNDEAHSAAEILRVRGDLTKRPEGDLPGMECDVYLPAQKVSGFSTGLPAHRE